MRKIVVTLVALLAFAGAACSSKDSGSTSSSGTTPPATSSGGSSSGCVDLTSGATFSITIQDLAFHPSCLTAKASQGISIQNKDSVLHSFTIDGTQIDVDIQPGTTFNGEPVTGILAPGTYTFHCKYHPTITGKITVE